MCDHLLPLVTATLRMSSSLSVRLPPCHASRLLASIGLRELKRVCERVMQATSLTAASIADLNRCGCYLRRCVRVLLPDTCGVRYCRLWVHELLHIFYHQLSSEADRQDVFQVLDEEFLSALQCPLAQVGGCVQRPRRVCACVCVFSVLVGVSAGECRRLRRGEGACGSRGRGDPAQSRVRPIFRAIVACADDGSRRSQQPRLQSIPQLSRRYGLHASCLQPYGISLVG